jgi:diguanylate cyclase (GGDEF)-like protein
LFACRHQAASQPDPVAPRHATGGVNFHLPIGTASQARNIIVDSAELRSPARRRVARALRQIGDAVLTTDFKQRRRAIVALMTAGVYATGIGILFYGDQRGMFREGGTGALALACAVVVTGFYAAIRSGFNLRFKAQSLALPQAICAQTLIAAAYAIAGPAHPSMLALSAMVMVFGMFEMRTRYVWLLVRYTLVLMGAVMYWCAGDDPRTYPPEVEIIHFAILATVLPAISSLSVQLRAMRERLQNQKAALETALEKIQRVATLDELTGLPNRRHMRALLADHIARFERGGPAFAVALADLDHFKHINDRYGHTIGDAVLSGFAERARAHLRSTDIVGRWGGEEFVAILAAPASTDVNFGVERLRRSLRETPVCAEAPDITLTFSAGITSYRDGEAIDDVIERADKALYDAKHAGRDRSVSR